MLRPQRIAWGAEQQEGGGVWAAQGEAKGGATPAPASCRRAPLPPTSQVLLPCSNPRDQHPSQPPSPLRGWPRSLPSPRAPLYPPPPIPSLQATVAGEWCYLNGSSTPQGGRPSPKGESRLRKAAQTRTQRAGWGWSGVGRGRGADRRRRAVGPPLSLLRFLGRSNVSVTQHSPRLKSPCASPGRSEGGLGFRERREDARRAPPE